MHVFLGAELDGHVAGHGLGADDQGGDGGGSEEGGDG